MTTVNSPMRVMHILSGDLWAGAEVQAYTLLRQLRDSCDLHVVLMNPGQLADNIAKLGIPLTILDESELKSLAIMSRLRRLMAAFRPDIVHTHRQKENILGSIANLLSIRARCLRTSHGAAEFAPQGLQRLQVMVNNFTGRFLQQAVIAVSSELHTKLARHFSARKIHMIHNGIDVTSLRAQVTSTDFRRNKPDHIHIGIIGRLEPVKRVDIFLAMAATLVEISPGHRFCFHVIGEGKLRPDLEYQSKNLNLAEQVQFHGHREDIPACISSLNAVVMCSDHEGTPMTALEALALGTPLIAHKTGGLIDVLRDFPQFLVHKHSAGGYAECLLRILSNPLDTKVHLRDDYLAETNAQNTMALYRTLLKPVRDNRPGKERDHTCTF